VTNTEANFFVFAFNLKRPVTVSLSRSTVTYLASAPGTDFTQTSFTCTTNLVPDPGCAAASGNEVEGISVNFVSAGAAPLPTWAVLTLAGALGLAAFLRAPRWRTT
jgi:hypothetical protein